MKNIISGIIAGAIVILSFSCNTHHNHSIKWGTFNIRYDNPADSINGWEYRKDSVADFIKDNSIDVIGLQEVLNNQLTDLKDRLPEYGSTGVGRDDGKEKGEYAPILYRKDKFELMESNTFWLSQYPDSAGFTGWDGACTRIATWARLRTKTNNQTIFTVNTHLDHVGREARQKGILLIIEKIKELAKDAPVVITGDFNVSDTSEVYQTITSADLKLIDAHKKAEKSYGVQYTFHNFGKQPSDKREKIDFIFVTPGIKVKESNIPEEGNLNGYYISDHNPQIVSLEFPE